MNPRHRRNKSVNSAAETAADQADEYQAEDAVLISRFLRSGSRPRKDSRKVYQLCRQVAETLNSLLSGECRDELLQSLYVASVTPAPDATQVLVTVQPLDPHAPVCPREILSRLQSVSPWLRSEVAHAITRRKAPHLVFQVHPQPDESNQSDLGEDRT